MAKKKQPATEPEPPLRLEWRSPQELAENPLNWRSHPPEQTAALADVIDEVGWAGACLYNQSTGRLIDGHARRKLAMEQGCQKVPVLVGNWSEEQERLILATLDPLAAMAEMSQDSFLVLMDSLKTDYPAMLEALQDMADVCLPEPTEPVAPVAPPEDFPSYDESIPTEHQCPKCGYQWSGKAGEFDGSVSASDRNGTDDI